MSFVINTYTLCNKGIVFDITPSFVAICVNWSPGHTYVMYLVLFLKLGATLGAILTPLHY
jgi:hypothetical protein